MRIEVVKEKLNQIIANYNLEIYSVKTKREFGEHILEILLKGNNLTSNLLEEIHTKLIVKLVDGDLDDHYYLELSSVGAERPIDSFEELASLIDAYIYFKANQYTGNATLKETLEESREIVVSVNLKGRIKNIKIKYEELSELRLAVKV